MTNCRVTVAAYSSLPAALADWDAIDVPELVASIGLVDAALVEGDRDTIRSFHRHSRAAAAHGAVAGAVVGLLRPPALVTGAVAGGVGGCTLTALGSGISRHDAQELGEVLDSAPISLVAVVAGPSPTAPSAASSHLLGHALRVATVGSTVSSADLSAALDADEADQRDA